MMKTTNPYEIIKIDKYSKKIQMPTLLLMTRSFDIIGKISHYDNWNISLVGNGLDEISFTVNKYVNGTICPIWDDLIDLKIIDVSGFGRFEISIDYTDNTQTVKSVHGISLETELGQIPLYEFHVNDEDAVSMEITDYNKDDFDEHGNFIPTVFYHEILPTDTEAEAEYKKKHSLLHRVLADKAPHWSIGYITPYIALDEESQPEPVEGFQRTYTVDGTTIYDFLTGDVAAESNVIFSFDTINRKINCYNLCDCIDQKTRKIMTDKDGKEVTGIGEDTNIFVSKNKLANEITISSNKDNVKNCFRIEGGDDIITDMVRTVNMNGSNYIYQFADFQYNDMPIELQTRLKAYQEMISSEKLHDEYYGNGDIDRFLNGTLTLYVASETEAAVLLNICRNNRITTANTTLSDYVNTPYWHINISDNPKSLCLSKVQQTPYKDADTAFNTMGIYTRLCCKYDELAYFKSSMMPAVTISDTTAEEQYNIMLNKLKTVTVGVSSLSNYNSHQFTGVTNNIIAMANILIDARYQAEVIGNSTSYQKINDTTYQWTGNIRITRISDSTDYYPQTQTDIQKVLSVNVNDDEYLFIKQKIEKALSNCSMSDIDFEIAGKNNAQIRDYFNKYSLNRLQSFYDGYNSCLSILMQTDLKSEAPKTLYDKYYNILTIISNPPTTENPNPTPGVLDIRHSQISNINKEIEALLIEQNNFQTSNKCNLQNYLGNDLYKIFCSYRREDTYANSNYCSDGLSDAECLAKAKELVEAATNEAKKACVLQRTISTSLNNLFALAEFEPLYDKFALFNYIRIRTEDEILKLRLIGIDFNGDSVENITVTFSDKIVSVDGTTNDLQSILQQTGSIATSYSSTALQAKSGLEAKNIIDDMYINGLNTAKTSLKSNDKNEICVTASGINCKRMDDEGYYGDKQLRITGNMLAFTKDNWKTTSEAIGEITYTDPVTKESSKKYGIIADAIIGKMIAGENMYIGNETGSVQITGEGINISEGTIYIADNRNINQGGTNTSIEINPNGTNFEGHNTDYVFNISKDDNVVMGVDNDGNGYFSGEINGSSINGGKINGGEININNKFHVYSDGTVSLPKGTFVHWEDIKDTPDIMTKEDDGENIHFIDVKYAVSDSSVDAPATGWSTTAPQWQNGKYMWQKTSIYYKNGDISESEPINISGAIGATGASGIGISGIQEQYYLSSSNDSQIDNSWKDTQDAWISGKYLWTRSQIIYTDGTTQYTTPVLADAINKANEKAALLKNDVDTLKDELTTLLRIESSRGTVFKNNMVSTVLSVVIYHGSKRITDYETMKNEFGNTAYLKWKWQRPDDESFGIISSDDKRFGDNGFTFTLSPEDVNTKITFMCELIV